MTISRSRARQHANMVLFLGPAILLLFLFFVAPVVVNLFVAFTDMGQTLRITTVTTENFERMLTRDRRLGSTLALTFVYVLGTLAIRTGKAIEYDASAMTITNNPEANAMLRTEVRKGFRVQDLV